MPYVFVRFQPDFDFLDVISWKSPNIKFHKNPFSFSHTHTHTYAERQADRQTRTDRCDENNTRFSLLDFWIFLTVCRLLTIHIHIFVFTNYWQHFPGFIYIARRVLVLFIVYTNAPETKKWIQFYSKTVWSVRIFDCVTHCRYILARMKYKPKQKHRMLTVDV